MRSLAHAETDFQTLLLISYFFFSTFFMIASLSALGSLNGALMTEECTWWLNITTDRTFCFTSSWWRLVQCSRRFRISLRLLCLDRKFAKFLNRQFWVSRDPCLAQAKYFLLSCLCVQSSFYDSSWWQKEVVSSWRLHLFRRTWICLKFRQKVLHLCISLYYRIWNSLVNIIFYVMLYLFIFVCSFYFCLLNFYIFQKLYIKTICYQNYL